MCVCFVTLANVCRKSNPCPWYYAFDEPYSQYVHCTQMFRWRPFMITDHTWHDRLFIPKKRDSIFFFIQHINIQGYCFWDVFGLQQILVPVKCLANCLPSSQGKGEFGHTQKWEDNWHLACSEHRFISYC